jgi:putative two-component system response regulator
MQPFPPEPAGHPDARILILDDQQENLRLLERLLQRHGYRQVLTLAQSRDALDTVLAWRPDLILLDLHMPEKDGFEVMAELAPHVSDTYLPILVLTGDQRMETKHRALSSGASDFVDKPFDMVEVLLRIRNLLQIRFLQASLRDQNAALEESVRQRTVELEAARLEVLERLALAAEYRDDATGEHTRRVGSLAARVGEIMGLDWQTVDDLRRAAPLHDVGKIGIPDAILLKPGPLTESEFDLMKTHTFVGAKLLSDGRSELIKTAEVIALSHHERWDGTGYPNALSGERIPLMARIVAVVDFYDALSHDRPYRGAWAPHRVRREIEAVAGEHLDPRIVEIFLSQVIPPVTD